MTENTENLPTIYNQVTGEKITQEQIISENENYQIVIGLDGKAKKKMKYKKYWSKIPTNDDELEQLFIIMSDNENEHVTPMSEANGEEFAIEQVYIEPYETIDEDTVSNVFGVTTTIKATNGKWYATSSKVAYYQLQNIFNAFGFPNTEGYKPIIVKINLKKEGKGKSTNLSFKGRVK